MRLRSGLLCLLLFAVSSPRLFAQERGAVEFLPDYTFRMLDHTSEVNRKQAYLLAARSSGLLETRRLYIGADIQVLGDYQRSNTEAKFGYLMRHPTQNNQGGRSVSELVLHDVNVAVTGTPTSWATAYFQLMYNPEQSFGAGTITSLGRNQLSLRRGYVLFGDETASPLYAAVGKMATPFGLTDTVNPFSASSVWHAFGGLTFGGLVGYKRSGLDLSFMGIQGGAQFRAANSGDATPDDLSNFTVNGSYTLSFGEADALRVGGGYLHGSAYCQPFPITHFSDCGGFTNPAWAVHGLLSVGRLTVLGEFIQTTKDWPGTRNPNPPLDVFPAHGVTAFDVGARIVVPVSDLDRGLALSGDFSRFVSGPTGSPWEHQDQLVFGAELGVSGHMAGFAEVVRTSGYVPLNFISGPDPFDPTEDPGTTHSVADANSVVILVGLRLAM